MYGGEHETNIRYAAKIQFFSSRNLHGPVSGPLSHGLAHLALDLGKSFWRRRGPARGWGRAEGEPV
jgi:hypothetical protein